MAQVTQDNQTLNVWLGYILGAKQLPLWRIAGGYSRPCLRSNGWFITTQQNCRHEHHTEDSTAQASGQI